MIIIQLHYIVIGIIFFILSLIVHELAHFLTAKHYGGNPKFAWVPKGHIKIFGGNPGVRYQDTMSLKHQKIIALSPIPFTIPLDSLTIVCVSLSWFDYSTAEPYKIYVFIILSIIFGIIITLVGSLSDIQTVRKLNEN